jgi:hypothetical protein
MTDRTVQALLDSLHRYERLALSLNEENKKLLVMNADIVAMANEAVFQRNEWKTEAGKLKAERDEARREVCFQGETIGGAMLEAELRGWNCFKEDTK